MTNEEIRIHAISHLPAGATDKQISREMARIRKAARNMAWHAANPDIRTDEQKFADSTAAAASQRGYDIRREILSNR